MPKTGANPYCRQEKPLDQQARGETAYGALPPRSGSPRRCAGRGIGADPPPTPDRCIVTLKQTVGVLGIIMPWTFSKCDDDSQSRGGARRWPYAVIKPSGFDAASVPALSSGRAPRHPWPWPSTSATGLPGRRPAPRSPATLRRENSSFTGSTLVGLLSTALLRRARSPSGSLSSATCPLSSSTMTPISTWRWKG